MSKVHGPGHRDCCPKHTQGPWALFNNRIIQNYGEERTVLFNVTSSDVEVLSEREANAQLVSAAPEMYALIESIVAEQESFGEQGDAELIRRCLEVLQRARGES